MKENITIAELAWLSGIIDGEGSIFIMKQKRKDRERIFNYILRVAVQSTDLIMAKECFLISEEGTYFTASETRENQSNSLKWQVNGRKAANILKELLPYMKVKKEQAKAAIKFQETTKKHWKLMTPRDYKNQEDFYYKLKQMKIDEKMGNNTVKYLNANIIKKTTSDFRQFVKDHSWRNFESSQLKPLRGIGDESTP